MRVCAGLDNAILGYLNADERKADPKRIAQLLAHGAHALQAPDEEAAQEGRAFAEEVRVLGVSWQPSHPGDRHAHELMSGISQQSSQCMILASLLVVQEAQSCGGGVGLQTEQSVLG